MASRRTKKKGLRKADLILIIGLIIIAIPVALLGYFIISAQLETKTPVLGDRYANDHDPEIEKRDLSDIESEVKNISGVEKVDVELVTGTLRVYLDVTDSASKDEISAIADEAYDKVTSILPVSTYFSQHDDMKMYDMEIHVYNLSDNRDSDEFIYLIKMQTSSMESPSSQFVSEAVDEALAESLRQDVEEANNSDASSEEDSGDITVGGTDSEEVAPESGETEEGSTD